MATSEPIARIVKTPGQVAKLFGVRPTTVVGWILAGFLPARNTARVGATRARWRVTEADLKTFDERRAAQPPAPAPARRSKSRQPVHEYV